MGHVNVFENEIKTLPFIAVCGCCIQSNKTETQRADHLSVMLAGALALCNYTSFKRVSAIRAAHTTIRAWSRNEQVEGKRLKHSSLQTRLIMFTKL